MQGIDFKIATTNIQDNIVNMLKFEGEKKLEKEMRSGFIFSVTVFSKLF
jgi:hypothetical protein